MRPVGIPTWHVPLRLGALVVLSAGAAFAGSAKSGQGNMTVSPATVVTPSTNAFTFAYRAPKNFFNAGSLATLSIPNGWSAPQTSNPSARGYVTVTPVLGGSTVSLQGISGAGPWLITLGFSTSQKQGGFNLIYQAATAAANPGVYTFTAQTAQSGSPLVVLKSGSPVITVDNLAKSNTTTSINSSLNPSVYGTMVTFTGTVSAAGTRIPTGTLTFKLGDVVLGTVALNTQALATFATNRFSVPDSPVSITAVYSGDTNFNASVSPILLQTVTAQTLSISGLAALGKVYDGSTAALLDTSAVVLGGVVPGDDVSLDAAAAMPVFSDPNAGLQKPVNVAGLALTGVDAAEYAIESTATLAADIVPAPLVVAANDTTRCFGAANPAFTASYNGFVAGESSSVIAGAPVFSTAATPASPVGGSPYAIVVTTGSLAAANYTFSFLPGRLTVVPGPGQLQKIVSAKKQPDGTCLLSCGGASGQTYVLEANSDLSTGDWIAIATNTTDVNGWMSCNDSSAPSSPRRFYRTRLP